MRFKVLALILSTLIVHIGADCNKPSYECFKDDPQKVRLGKNIFKCGNEEVCNSNYVEPCRPCVNLLEECKKSYTCDLYDPYALTIYDIPVKCPKDYVCNPEYSADCKPCIVSKCKAEQILYKCDKSNNSTVIYDGTKLTCPDRTICNHLMLAPCNGCIPAPEPPERKHYNKYIHKGDRWAIPNCNDGDGFDCPCRHGAPNSGVYFRCLWEEVGFKVEIQNCNELENDPVCIFNQDICRDNVL